jgi:hypothetical protein
MTYSWFVFGALVGGLALSMALIALRQLGGLLPPSVILAAGFAGAAALVGASILAWTPPSLERQVDHRWLDRYRGWVIGAGFGFQLGAGVLTRIPSLGLYVLALCALLGAPPSALLISGVGYAALRGMSAAPGGWVNSPHDLQHLMHIIARYEPLVAKVGRTTDLAALGCVVAALLIAAV